MYTIVSEFENGCIFGKSFDDFDAACRERNAVEDELKHQNVHAIVWINDNTCTEEDYCTEDESMVTEMLYAGLEVLA